MLTDIDLLSALPAMWRYARFLRPRDDPEDLLQATCEKAIVQRDKFYGGNPDAWLLTLMRNVNTDARRREIVRPAVSTTDIATPPRQEAIVYAIEVMNAVARLPVDERRLIALQAVERSFQEAADIEAIPLGTQKSRLNRARRRLVEMLK